VSDRIDDLSDKGGGLGDLIEQSAPFARYMQWREEERRNFLHRLNERAGGRLVVRQAENTSAAMIYTSLSGSGGFRIAIERGALPVQDEQVPIESGAYEYALRFNPTCDKDGADLVTRVSQLARAGVEVVTLDDFGLWTESALTYVKQALRFGRRAAST